MKSLVPDRSVVTAPIAPPASALVPVSERALVPVGGTLSSIVAHNDRFLGLLETRGAKPQTRGRLASLLNSKTSWIPLIGASAALVASPSFFVFELGGFLAMGAAGLFSMGAAWVAQVDMKEDLPAPLVFLTRSRALTTKDLAFLRDTDTMSPLEQAALSQLAVEWMRRIDQQQVVGDAAYVALEKLAAKGLELPESVRNEARKLLALNDAIRDPETGQHRRELDMARVDRILRALRDLPAAEQQAIAPTLQKLFFKNEAPRFATDSNATSRALYRGLLAAAERKGTESLPQAGR